jgi:hypothetical protein
MSFGFICGQCTKKVWVQAGQQPLKRWDTGLATAKWWLQLFGIHKVSILSKRPKISEIYRKSLHRYNHTTRFGESLNLTWRRSHHSCEQCKISHRSKDFQVLPGKSPTNGPDLPCSPKFAPSEFLLFRHVKHALDGVEFAWADTLLAAVQSGVSDLIVDILRTVFANWVERLKWVALNEGHCDQ